METFHNNCYFLEILIQLLLGPLRKQLVLWLRLEPEAEWNGNGWDGHDDECNPIEEVWWELFVELGQVDDSSLSGLGAGGVLKLKKNIFLLQK